MSEAHAIEIVERRRRWRRSLWEWRCICGAASFGGRRYRSEQEAREAADVHLSIDLL
ncbi:MAG: hypothetical protein ACLQNG_13380 [Acidimicrobiales bacterium]